MSKAHKFDHPPTRLGWLLSGFAVFCWIIFLKDNMDTLMGRVPIPGETLPFLVLLTFVGTVPGIVASSLGTLARKIISLIILIAATIFLGYWSVLILSGESIIALFFHFFWFVTALFSLTTIALFLLFTGRRRGWQFRLAGIVLAIFFYYLIPTQARGPVYVISLTLLFGLLCLLLIRVIRSRPAGSVFHFTGSEVSHHVPVTIRRIVSVIRILAGIVLAFCLTYGPLDWLATLAWIGTGSLTGWLLAWSMNRTRLRYGIYIIPLLLPVTGLILRLMVFGADTPLRQGLGMFFLFLIYGAMDRLILGANRLRLRFFYLAFTGLIVALPVLYAYENPVEPEKLLALSLLLPFLYLLTFLRTWRRFAVALFGILVFLGQSNWLAPRFPGVRQAEATTLTACPVPELENVRSVNTWNTPGESLSHYEPVAVRVMSRLWSNSLVAALLGGEGGWVEFISPDQVRSGRKAREYAGLVLETSKPAILITTLPVERPGHGSYTPGFGCYYYYNEEAATAFSADWFALSRHSQGLRKQDPGAAIDVAGFLAREEQGADLPAAWNNLKPWLLNQQFSRMKMLLKKRRWKILESEVNQYLPYMKGVPGFWEFLEKFYSFIQKEQQLVTILEQHYQQQPSDQANTFRLAAILSRRGAWSSAIYYAKQIPPESRYFREARYLLLDTYLSAEDFEGVMEMLDELAERYPEDASLRYKRTKVKSIMKGKGYIFLPGGSFYHPRKYYYQQQQKQAGESGEN